MEDGFHLRSICVICGSSSVSPVSQRCTLGAHVRSYRDAM